MPKMIRKMIEAEAKTLPKEEEEETVSVKKKEN